MRMAPSISLHSVVTVSPQHFSRVLGDEAVILDAENGLYFGLNAVGTRIWALLEHPIKVSEIQRLILDEFEVDAATCEQDLCALLNELLARNLIGLLPSSAPSSDSGTSAQ
jgi:hypothetical protein